MEESAYPAKRVIIGINHDPQGHLPEFSYQLLRLCRYIVKETDCSPVLVPFARETEEDSVEQILKHVSGEQFDYFILLKDTVYPPIYCFNYFYNYKMWVGKDAEALGGVVFDPMNQLLHRYPDIKYGEITGLRPILWPSDFFMCTADYLKSLNYDAQKLMDAEIRYDGRLCCDKAYGTQFSPSSATVNKYLLEDEKTPFQFGGFRFLHEVVRPEALTLGKEILGDYESMAQEERDLRG